MPDLRPTLQRQLSDPSPPLTTPPTILPQIFRPPAFDLLDLSPLELARQITLIQFGLFSRVSAREFLQEGACSVHMCVFVCMFVHRVLTGVTHTAAWSGQEGAVRAPQLTAAIANFNQLCGWITSLIVSTRPPIPRIALMHRFVDIAKCTLELQNYNGTMAIVGALLANPVHRLRDDWVR